VESVDWLKVSTAAGLGPSASLAAAMRTTLVAWWHVDETEPCSSDCACTSTPRGAWRRGPNGLRRFERGDYEERPWQGGDALILHAGWTAIDVRYVIREPESGRVWKAWSFPFRPDLTAVELYDWILSLR
jgi:hypothetical protein